MGTTLRDGRGGRRAVASLIAAVLAGVSLALAAPPHERPALAFVFAPLLYTALRGGPIRATRAFGLGLAAGAAFSFVAIDWAVPLVARFGGFPPAAAMATAAPLAVVQGLPPAIGCAAAAAASDARRLHLVLPIALAFAFSAVPVIFPYRPGHMVWAWTTLVQLVDLGGLGLLDLVIGLAGCGVAAALVDRRPRAAAIGALALAGAFAYGHVRLPVVAAARAAAPVLRVGVVQPDVRVEEGLDSRFDGARLARLRAATVDLERRGADVVVWPEAAYPHVLDRDARADRRGDARVLGDGVRGPVVFGAMTARSPCERWNSLVALDAKGRIVDRADKIALFPFAEYVPLWRVLPFLRDAYPCEGLVAGTAEPLLEVAGARLGVLNCYEDVTDRYARALAPLAPELLVGSASDAWYGDTAQPLLHRRVASFRAVELRRDLVRASNTGESSFTAATGEDVLVAPVYARAAFVADARRLAGRTVYAVVGDVVSAFAAATLALLAVARAARGRRAEAGEAP